MILHYRQQKKVRRQTSSPKPVSRIIEPEILREYTLWLKPTSPDQPMWVILSSIMTSTHLTFCCLVFIFLLIDIVKCLLLFLLIESSTFLFISFPR